MRNRNHKKILKLKHFLIAVFLLIILTGIVIPLIKKIKISLFANKEVELIETKLEEIEQENSELKKLITYFNTSEYIEEQARLNLNYRKTDEKVVVIYGQDEDAEQKENNINANLNSKSKLEAKNNPNRWWQYFFDKY